jgi:DNA helicase HerA-like ATPase
VRSSHHGSPVTAVAGTVDELREHFGRLRHSLQSQGALWEGAWSLDGHTFEFEVAVSRPLPLGGYVELATADGRRYLGQVTSEAVVARPGPDVEVDLGVAFGGGPLGSATVNVEVRAARGDGRLLAAIADGEYTSVGSHDTFDTASVKVAAPDLVDDHLRATLGSATGLETAAAIFGGDTPVPLLRAKGFNRHTFLCGQSGSGKTYGLGVVLERLLWATTLPLIVLDPNSDYVGLRDLLDQQRAGIRDDAEYAAVAAHWSSLAGRIAVVGGVEGDPLRIRFGRLAMSTRARVLGLDPLHDAEEYDRFRRLSADASEDETVGDLAGRALATLDETARRLAVRIRNLGVVDWEIWAQRDETPVLDTLPDDPRAIIVDLGRLDSLVQRSVVASSALEWLWSLRYERRPRLIVIDEAHNVCPQHPVDNSQAAATDLVVRIAAEGRKYGLYLLLSTQQPQKIHANVLSQCDNLMLLRMNSSSDIARLADVFSFVPPALLGRAATFRLGDGLVAGRIAPHPVLTRGARRWTREGGADVPTTWASRAVAQ